MVAGSAALLGVVLVASAPVGAQGTGAPAAEPASSGTAPSTRDPKRPPATDKPGVEPPRKKASDEELIRNLDRIEQLELLQNLELFDTAAPRKK